MTVASATKSLPDERINFRLNTNSSKPYLQQFANRKIYNDGGLQIKED